MLAPLLTWCLGARESAVLLVGVHAITGAQGIRGSAAHIRWRSITVCCLAALLAAAMVAPRMQHIRQAVLRREVAATIVVLSLLHLLGVRLRNRGGVLLSLGVGLLSGAMTAASGLGGPPAAMFLAGQSEEKHFLRGNLTAYFMILYISTFALFLLHHQVSFSMLRYLAVLTPAFALGNVCGERLFHRLPTFWFDRGVGLLLMAAGVAMLF